MAASIGAVAKQRHKHRGTLSGNQRAPPPWLRTSWSTSGCQMLMVPTLCMSWLRSLSSSSGAFLSASFSFRTYAWWCLRNRIQYFCNLCWCLKY